MEVSGGFSGDQKIEVIDGVPVPEKLWVKAVDPAWPFDVRIDVRLERGRMTIARVAYDVHEGKDLESGDLRIPLLQIFRAGVASALAGLSALAGRNLAAIKEEGPTEENLKVVAAAYRLAYLSGHAPTQAVAELLQLQRPTAAKWVQRARDEGALGPAEERRAGEKE